MADKEFEFEIEGVIRAKDKRDAQKKLTAMLDTNMLYLFTIFAKEKIK